MLALANLEALCRDNEFSSSAIEKGLRYARQGRVVNSNIVIKGATMEIHARVAGGEKYPYQVVAEIEAGKDMYVEGTCTCTVGFNCKHVVAAIAAASGHAPKSSTTGPLTRIKPEPAAPAPPKLSPELQYWLGTLQPPAPRLPAQTPPRPPKSVLYVLKMTTGYDGTFLRVTIMQAPVRKNGELGRPARSPLPRRATELLDDPKAAPDRDLLISLFGHYGYFPELSLTGASAPGLLRRLVETGRCFWNDPASPPLSLGDPRPAKLAWKELNDGSQKTILDAVPPPSEFLPLSPPWYIDETTHTCGPLAVEGDPTVITRWLAAPLVTPEEATLIAASAASLDLPAPAQFTIRNRRGVRPLPILRLARIPLAKPAVTHDDNWRPITHTAMDVAWIEADYDGLRTVVDRKNLPLTRRVGSTLERIHRMARIEEGFINEVESSGIYAASELGLYSHHEELRDKYAMHDPEEWMQWMVAMLPGAEKEGWRIEIDPTFSYRPAAIDEWYSETTGSGEDWFAYELGIVVEGERINLLPILGKAMELIKEGERDKKKANVIQWRLPDGRIVPLPVERLRAIASTLAELFDPEAVNDGKIRVNRLRAAELIDLNVDTPWRGPEELRELSSRLRAFSGIVPVPPPPGLQATLRPYQSEGLSWLQFLREHNFGGILADDMGLGKTVQAIAHVLAEKDAGRADLPSLVIAPTSLMPNWRAEAEKFAPDLKVLILHGGDRKERFDEIPAHHLVVTSYALLPRDREILQKQKFHLLILDEAQYIKNPKTQWADIVRNLSARHRLCMTGTPMENHLGELWSLLHFLSPGYLGTEKQFKRIYRDPIEKAGDKDRRTALARRVRPFIMRRRKEDVAKDLPEKNEIVRTVELAGKQRDLYETIRLAMHERVRAEVEKKGLARSHIVILDALLKLRQVCCDPRLVKLDRAKSVKESAKLELLKELLPEMLSEGRRVLLFSQFTSMLDLIEPAVNALKIPFVRLDGSTANRETPVKKFQAGEVPLFLISLKAGGTGLNLTAADTVIHYDPWWNPAVERQATDRAHRIGQEKKVFVYKLITAGTVEEKILAMQERKKELVAGLLGEGAQENLQLTKDDLNHLFDPLG
jgi:superfamily II DNA or RNA helicase